ncbi:DUF4153 domain-containing protein [Cedecea davisae]|uniref:DUF4153 domain-containing protein n=1 Tax=Cedecea davisae TaxID=158484 RepID=UPI001D0A4BFF|nr:DUF4153 domain-containing protein [Cedecea davisae]
MFLSEPLPRATRWGILLAGFLLGIVLYLTDSGRESGLWLPGENLALYLRTLSVVLATTVALLVVRFGDRRFWGLALLPMPFVALMSGWVNWNAHGLERWVRHDVLLGYQCALVAIVLLALPWLQGRLRPGNGWGSWREFYNQLWRNGITLLLTGLLVLFFWGVLALWAVLFKLVDITFFDRLFFDTPAFAWIATCTAAALAVTLCRDQKRAISAVKHFFSVFATGLLPLLSLIALMFLATLPVVGLGSISQHVSCNALLNTLTLMVMVTAAVVYHPEREARPYPTWMDGLIKLTLFLSPVYSLLASYALWLRVSSYGWTPARVYAALITITVVVWAFGYAVALVRQRREPVLQPGWINRAVLLLALALLVAVNSPLLDPYRISVNNQMARYHSGVLKPEKLSLSMLQSSGRRGYDAMRELQKDSIFSANPERKRQLARILSDNKANGFSAAKLTVESLRQRIVLADKNRVPEDAWWQAMVKDESYQARECLDDDDKCLLVGMDLNGDGKDEWLLCQPEMSYCKVYGKIDGGWKDIGQARDLDKNQMMAALKQAATEGKLTAAPKAWQDVMVDGQRVKVDYYR